LAARVRVGAADVGDGIRGAVRGSSEVVSIQTFGSYANIHPHIHALVTNGMMAGEGEFLPFPEWTAGVIGEVFRRLVLRELVRAERVERVERTMVRPPMAFGVVEETEEGRVRVETPADPRTGERGVELDPLGWMHALGRQVPDPRTTRVPRLAGHASPRKDIESARMEVPSYAC
jgi:hypothetical protein